MADLTQTELDEFNRIYNIRRNGGKFDHPRLREIAKKILSENLSTSVANELSVKAARHVLGRGDQMTPDHYLIHGDGLTEARAQLRKNLARLDSVVERGFSVGDAEPLSKMSVYDLRDLAEKLGADKKKLYGTSKQALIIIIDQLRANSARGDAGMSPKAKKIIDDYMKELDKQKANGVSTSPELVAAMVKGIMEANPITAGDAGKYVTTSISQAHKWGETFASQGKSWDEVAAILKAEGTDKLTVQRIKQAFEEQVARG